MSPMDATSWLAVIALAGNLVLHWYGTYLRMRLNPSSNGGV